MSFMAQPLEVAAQRVPHWLQAVQAKSQSQWQSTTLPTRRTENWKYTSLQSLRDDYTTVDADQVPPAELPAQLATGFGGVRLVFVDGVYQAELSGGALPAGLSLCRFDEADDEQAALIAEHLDRFTAQSQMSADQGSDTAAGPGKFLDDANQ